MLKYVLLYIYKEVKSMETILNRGYKFKIKPNKEQKEFLLKSFGCSRKVYNYYVDSLYNKLENQKYENRKLPNITLESPATLKNKFEYLKEVDSLALCNAQISFKKAMKKFNSQKDKKSYKKSAKRREKNLGIAPSFKDLKGIPKFKSIKNSDFSYTTNNQSRGGKWKDIELNADLLYLPKLKTPIKVVKHRDLPQGAIIKNSTISMDSKGVFTVSLCVEFTKDIYKKQPLKTLGLDYAQQDFYYSSEDKKANYPKYYRLSEEKLAKEQRKLSRKIKCSNNWEKQKKKISKLHKKIANQRLDWIHKESTKICNEFDAIIFEDIDLRNMAQCLSLGKNLHDNGFGMFRNFCKYKLEEQGKQFIKIDMWFPSSKLCSSCGVINDNLELSDRVWECPTCGSIHNRDYNASINIKEAGQSLLAW